MAKTDHVILRDGSANLGGPRPPVPSRPRGPDREAEGAGQFGGGYSDSKTVGVYPVDFNKVRAHRNPRPLRTEVPVEKPPPGEPINAAAPLT